ncbi:MAG TPA: hypothetical protein VMB50_24810 [Myxococcales bacterium]|nr:hypothetical protein [Myxococcales bacterium]
MRLTQIALLFTLGCGVVAPPAQADDDRADSSGVKAQLRRDVVDVLAQRDGEHRSFSRGMPRRMTRRVRVTSAPLRDSRGHGYVTFSVDARPLGSSGAWRRDSLTGCIYPDAGAIYLGSGTMYRPAAFLLGEKTDLVSDPVCRPAG